MPISIDLSTILRRCRALVLALLAATLVLPAFAQDDPPGRVGRIAWTSGDVYLNNPDTGELGAAPLNQPLTSGDVVTTGSGARAEIQIGAMTLRFDADSRIAFDRIDDEQVRVVLDGGRIIAKLPTEDTRRDFVLDAGNGRFLPRDTGIYRFDRDGTGTVATAYFGTLRFEGRDTAFDVNAGEGAHVWNDGAGRLNYRMVQGVRDEFTQWSAARDQQQRSVASSRYVSPEMTGVQDLDAYGDWSETPDYGAVWFPRAVSADWAPYREGHWAWIAPWGWTWVGREPWGFAPFHYGRWVSIRGAWAWVPGTRVVRPVYAPALVAWVGTPGGGVSVSVGSHPPVGWFPLAPREVYVPFYRASPRHVRFVNAPHVPHLGNADRIASHPREAVRDRQFVYRHEPRAFSTAPAEAFDRPRHGVRIAPRPGDPRNFGERGPAVVRPAPEPPRPREPERIQRPDAHFPQPSPRIDGSPRRPAPVPPPVEAPSRHDRPEAGIVPQPAPMQHPGMAGSRRDADSPADGRRERREDAVRRAPPVPTPAPAVVQPPRPAMERPEPRTAPPAVRERAYERPREFQRPQEQRPEMRVAPPQVERREERAPSPQRMERQQERQQERHEIRREERRDADRRPGGPPDRR